MLTHGIAHLCCRVFLELVKSSLCFIQRGLRRLRLFREHIALARGDIDFRLLGVDLGRPRLQLLLLDLDLIMEDLRLS